MHIHVVGVFDVVVAVVIRLAEVEIILEVTLPRARAGFNTEICTAGAAAADASTALILHLYLLSFTPVRPASCFSAHASCKIQPRPGVPPVNLVYETRKTALRFRKLPVGVFYPPGC